VPGIGARQGGGCLLPAPPPAQLQVTSKASGRRPPTH
jgi:hypothetical protein